MRVTFDRGTLLVPAQPGDARLEGIDSLLWDPRVQAYRAPAFQYEALVTELQRRRCTILDEVRQDEGRPAASASLSLRPYQEAALAAWELGQRRGVVVLPTGSGKTRLALSIMARLGTSTLCLVPTRMLVEQWLREIASHYATPIGCLGDGRRDLRPVTVATFESAYRLMDQIGNRFELLILDEAHHFGVGLRDEALEMCVAPLRLGLTATPPRNEPAASRLAQLMGPVVFELGIGDLAGAYLSDFDILTMQLSLTVTERATYDALIRRFRDIHAVFLKEAGRNAPWAIFARWAARTREGRLALSGLRRARKLLAFTESKRKTLAQLLARHRDARVLVFTADNETAYAVARKHLIMPLTCDIGRPERETTLERFRRGELSALVSARVLNEGVDVPNADVAIIVGAAHGEREHVQRVGRLLRPGPNKRALVYELVMRGTIEVGQARRRNESLAPRIAAQY
jgi:superfamily II DNA or RNA helicase